LLPSVLGGFSRVGIIFGLTHYIGKAVKELRTLRTY
jgi:hypothetical protein